MSALDRGLAQLRRATEFALAYEPQLVTRAEAHAILSERDALLDVDGAARQLVRRDISIEVVALCKANLLAALVAVEASRV